MQLTQEKYKELEEMAYQIRRLSLEMITCGKWGHPGGSFSMAEILSVLYFNDLRVDPKNPDWPERDRLVYSKAHASPALYAALALKGFFPIDDIYCYCQFGGLDGHTDMNRTKGLETSGGSLGMGLSIAVGMALGLRKKELSQARVYCIIGDGESTSGNIWEAAMSAGHYHLDNLITILDYNRLMAKGYVWEEMGIEPIRRGREQAVLHGPGLVRHDDHRQAFMRREFAVHVLAQLLELLLHLRANRRVADARAQLLGQHDHGERLRVTSPRHQDSSMTGARSAGSRSGPAPRTCPCSS